MWLSTRDPSARSSDHLVNWEQDVVNNKHHQQPIEKINQWTKDGVKRYQPIITIHNQQLITTKSKQDAPNWQKQERPKHKRDFRWGRCQIKVQKFGGWFVSNKSVHKKIELKYPILNSQPFWRRCPFLAHLNQWIVWAQVRICWLAKWVWPSLESFTNIMIITKSSSPSSSSYHDYHQVTGKHKSRSAH